MKSPVLLSTICITLGAAIGWFARSAESPAESTTQSQADEAKVRPRAEASARPTPRNRTTAPSSRRTPAQPREMTEVQRSQVGVLNSDLSNMLKNRQQQKFDARIAKLVTELSLSPAQEAELRKILAAQIDRIDRLESGDLDPGTLAGLSGVFSGNTVDEAISGLLTVEQKEAHEALQKREYSNKVEARALKELAKLSALDLSPEQKDQVYDLLYKEAETSIDARANGPGGAVITLTDGMGLDPDDLGIPEGLITGAAEGGTMNPQEMMAKMKQSREEDINRKVEALRPILNDQQLEQYRNDLQRKSGGILGGLMGGFENGQKGD